MVFTNSTRDREYNKFADINDNPYVRVTFAGGYQDYDATLTVSSGTGTHDTTTDFNNTLKQIIITPTNDSTAWLLKLKRSDGTVFRKLPLSGTLTGWRQFTADIPLKGIVTIELSSVTNDEDIDIKMVYT